MSSYVPVLLHSVGVGHRAFRPGADHYHCGHARTAWLRTHESLDGLRRPLGLWSDDQCDGAFGSAAAGTLGDMAAAAGVAAGGQAASGILVDIYRWDNAMDDSKLRRLPHVHTVSLQFCPGTLVGKQSCSA